MCKVLCKITFYCFILFISNHLLAQSDVIRQEGCDISVYKHSIDSLKQLYSTQGFTVLREAAINMESEYEMPIILPLTQGTLYQFVFIGDPSSKLYEVRMYDNNDKQVLYKKNMWGDVDGNIISYPFIPQFSEYHMIKPLQVNKTKKKLCGYVMLLKKTS